ncbi:hypothetical protein OK016_27360 [Vibrio chagasii]|nr:hypothetical protein [Vibrio chagasii]
MGGDLESALEVWAYVISSRANQLVGVRLEWRDVALMLDYLLLNADICGEAYIAMKATAAAQQWIRLTFVETDGSAGLKWAT